MRPAIFRTENELRQYFGGVTCEGLPGRDVATEMAAPSSVFVDESFGVACSMGCGEDPLAELLELGAAMDTFGTVDAWMNGWGGAVVG